MISQNPKIFTSYYDGLQIGKSISISLYLPKGCNFDHLPLFAPSEQLLKFWKTSKKDKYTETFKQELDAKHHLIDLWIKKIDSEYLTLNCYEKPDEFCHRHILKDYLPADMWEGEIAGSRNISVRDASWSQIFDNRWRIIFDNKPAGDKPVVEPVTATKAKTRQRKAA